MTETTSRKDVGMLNEASPDSVRSSIRPSSVRSVTPSFYWESDTVAFYPSGGGGRLEWRFFFQAVFGVECEQWTFHASFIWARGGGFFFLSANGKAQGALLLFLLSLGGKKDFFSIFPCFPMCSHNVPSKFLMGSQCVPQVHNVFLNMFYI
jgi:hypothetical protein